MEKDYDDLQQNTPIFKLVFVRLWKENVSSRILELFWTAKNNILCFNICKYNTKIL